GRAVHSELINTEFVKEWLQCCKLQRGSECYLGDHKSPNDTANLRVLDVARGCLVGIPFSSRYVVLSYVGVTVQSLQTRKDNVNDLEEDGALLSRSAEVPQTTRDSITLMSQIGDRNFWVDALCIFQDDLANKI
ncbi:hypothetical protein K469DRAFT_525424, partial [Zopfia rhizophila CBS 207.26]